MAKIKINCPNCGKKIPEYASKCKYCDTRLKPGPVSEPAHGSRPHFIQDSHQTRVTAACIGDALKHLEPVIINFSGKNLMILLTPSHVQASPKGPGLFVERAEFPFDIKKGAVSVHADHWVKSGYGQKQNFSLKILESACKFPVLDDTGSSQEVNHEVVEVALPGAASLLTKRSVTGVSQEKEQRIETACSCDRYWFSIPRPLFQGDPRYGSVHLTQNDLKLTNRTYARQFASLNQINDGKWLNRSDLKKRTGAWLAFGVGMLILLFSLMDVFFRLEGAPRGVTANIILGTLGLILFVGGFYGIYQVKGEPV